MHAERQLAESSPRSHCADVALGTLTHLGLLLMQLYLDVRELGPEVFIGSLKGDNECLGLLALISPFLGHCSFLSGVCGSLIPFTRELPCYCFLSRSAMFEHLLRGGPR